MILNKKIKKIILILIINVFLLISFTSLQVKNNVMNDLIYEGENNIENKNNIQIAADDISVWIEKWGSRSTKVGETGYDIAIDDLDNIYIVGSQTNYNSGLTSVILLKYDTNGTLLWEESWSLLDQTMASDMAIDNTNNLYIAANTKDSNNNETVCILRYNSNGVRQWNVTWGDSFYVNYATGIAVDNLGDVYVEGYTEYTVDESEIFLLKYNSNGVMQWNETWNKPGVDLGGDLFIDNATNIYITGSTQPSGTLDDPDLFILKYNSSAEIQWYNAWGFSREDGGIDITMDNSNNLYVAGFSSKPGTKEEYDICLVKFNSLGVLQWNTTWGGKSGEICNGIALDSLDDIYIIGSTESYGSGSVDLVLLKYNSTGDLLWRAIMGDESANFGFAIAIDGQDNIYITGLTDYKPGENLGNLFLLKYDPDYNFFPYEEEIPGFDLQFLIGIIYISTVSLVIIKKRSKLVRK